NDAGDSSCEIASVDPDPVPLNILSRIKSIRWCVVNHCNNLGPLIVEVDNFRVEATPSMTDPFGSTHSENRFNSGAVRTNNGKHKSSKPATKLGTFKYDVHLLDLAGNPINDKDPHVVISGTLDPGLKQTSNKNNNNK